ncbi:DUF4082 domain-containing protein [Actinocrispum wychmicini]|uniref:Uncharacterized protein DUF4082 n=1 Tax=Actinocrispum wychmicini TaxID=1213861 RepID=A0A4R2IXT2_9PSEU|nr:DUF4082 domain-containing protein [Actinocrispum wychmicini]TCO49762.1 uncharacterized protein DUF4082 [Actinocrispum wychmicini]
MFRLSRWTAVVATLTLTVFGAPVAAADDSPFSSIYTPTDGVRAEVGEPVLLTGGSIMPNGTAAERVELTFDDGATWIGIDWPTLPWHYLLTPTQPGDITFRARGWFGDTVGETSPPRTFRVGTGSPLGPANCDLGCFYTSSAFPHNEPDTDPVELGVRFTVDRPLRLNAAYLVRGTYQGPITVRVWGPDGTLLHEHVDSVRGEWPALLSAPIDPPVPLQPNVDYVVSYYTPQGGYRQNEDFFIGTLLSETFTFRADAGVFHYGEGGGFPTDTWGHSNYAIFPHVIR